MNCFDWQNQTSDYLDGTLIGPLKQEADEHLEKCEACNTRYKHFRLLLTSISGQPRATLPVAIRKAPLSSPSTKNRRVPLLERLRTWQNAPWYIRVPVEGAGIVLLISLAISSGPSLRMLYEKKVERSLTEYNEGLSSEESNPAASAQLARGNIAAPDPTAGNQGAGNDDFSTSEGDNSADSDTAEDSENDPAPKVIKATSSDTWRFNLKTDSPHDFRIKIVKILMDLKVPANTPGIGGIEAPGGIQFDLIVPQSIIPDLKQALEKIAPVPPKELADSPFGETFTWYKKKTKNPIAVGQTHLVIWLAQI